MKFRSFLFSRKQTTIGEERIKKLFASRFLKDGCPHTRTFTPSEIQKDSNNSFSEQKIKWSQQKIGITFKNLEHGDKSSNKQKRKPKKKNKKQSEEMQGRNANK
jgi:hypothetical protein